MGRTILTESSRLQGVQTCVAEIDKQRQCTTAPFRFYRGLCLGGTIWQPQTMRVAASICEAETWERGAICFNVPLRLPAVGRFVASWSP